jgi:hypothetical protein
MNAKLFDAALDLSQVNLAFYWSKRGELDLYLPGDIVTIFGTQLEATLQILHLHHIPVEVMA